MTKLILFILLSSLLGAFTIESSFENAHSKAINENKILMVFLTTPKCKECNRVLQHILTDKNLSTLIEKEAIFSIIQKGQKESYPIELLYTLEYPALFFLDKEELFVCDTLSGVIPLKSITKCLISESQREKKRDK